MVKVMKRWLDAAVDGFVSTPFPICASVTAPTTRTCETHAIIRKLRAELDAYAKGRHAGGSQSNAPERT